MTAQVSVLNLNDMERLQFEKLLLKTAFSCMACDGDIDKREIQLIKRLHQEKKTFGEIDVNSEMDNLLVSINNDGHQFMKDFFDELSSSKLSETNELNLIEVAIDTIKADEKVEYSEIKFFKVIRSMLNIANESILEKHPDFEDYLEQDIITDSYLERLQNEFFDAHILNEFELITQIDEDIFNSSKEKDVE